MNNLQKTIAANASFSGVGLHTGAQVNIELFPSAANSGIQFKRTDLENQPIVEALVENVNRVDRSTALQKGDAIVSTVEHLLASLTALEIDNCLIEIDGPEVPILDGSAEPFMEKLIGIGTKELKEKRNFIEIKEAIHFKDDQKGAEFSIVPHDGFEVEVNIDYNSKVLGKQKATLASLSDFREEIAACRTFCFFHELEALLEHNLIKGGDVDNAIVVVEHEAKQETLDRLSKIFNKPDLRVVEQGILNNVKLHFENEPARHKLLDVIGDLTLLGRPIKGKIIANKPGHSSNVAFGKAIKAQISIMENQPKFNVHNTVLDVEGIKKLLPHRPPFLFVDRIIEMSPERVVGVKNVSVNEDLFRGHFPDQPIFPGVLQIEAMAQVGGVLVLSQLEEPEKHLTYFMKMDKVKFRKMVVPGDTLVFELTYATPYRRGIAHMLGRAYVNDELVAEAEMMAKIEKVK